MSIVQELENAVDIVDLVNRYTNLKKAWANYKAVCPFPWHSEKTPSFIVSPSKQLAYCFWCHKWWGPLKFIMDIENCSFKEAVDILWSITWIETNTFKDKSQDFRNIFSIHKDINNYYTKTLKNYPKMEKYLYDRWITSDDIKAFNLWFADSWLELYNYLKNKWYDDKLIWETWVFLDLKSKKDKFLNRIIFPIVNQRWDFVAFAWRVVNNQMPKYINSPATDLYDKSSILYGLYQARNAIVKKDFVIITEWYMDTIALHRYDFKNTVCVSGTALTEKHIPIIKRLTKKIYLCFDGDEAGQKATISSIEMLKNKDCEVKIIRIKWWKDPDEFLASWWDFNELIKNAFTPIWYYFSILEKKYNLDSLDEKKKALAELLNTLKSYSNNIEVDFYLKEISNKLDIKLEVIYTEYRRLRWKREANPKKIKTNNPNIEDIILAYIIEQPELINIFDKQILFKENLWVDLKNILSSWVEYFEKLDLDKQNFIKWLTINISEKIAESNKENMWEQIKFLVNKINSDTFKKVKQNFVEKMKKEPDNLEILTKYNDFLQISIKNWLK